MPKSCRHGRCLFSEKLERATHSRTDFDLNPFVGLTSRLLGLSSPYVGENLLLRGGYRKTHFQADQTTLQSVSEMGVRFDGIVSPLSLPAHDRFILRFTRKQEFLNKPETCRFKEPILQSAIRRHLTQVGNLRVFLALLDLQIAHPEGLEGLGEMAIPLGHIDLLLKQRVPLGSNFKIPIEVKTKRATPHDVAQLRAYMDELRDDCQIGVLIAADFARTCVRKAADSGMKLVRYSLALGLEQPITFEEIVRGLTLEPIEK